MSRRLLKVVGLLSLLLVGVIVNSIVRGEDAPALNPVAAAAANVEDYPGFNFNLYVVYSSTALPGPITARGNGTYNGQTNRARMTLSLRSPATGKVLRLLEITDDTHTYTKNSALSSELPPGKEWVRAEKDAEGDADLDFDETMRMLSDSGNVRMVGHQSVNGRMTRHYRGDLTISTLVELLREQDKGEVADAYESLEGVAPTGISTDVWIDRKDLVRRLRFVMPTPGKDGEPPMTLDTRMDLFNFGSHPDIQLPDPATVVDGPLDDSAAPSSATAS